ncbi:hypothetical protein EVG20_g5707 [Dentipellis fragilis]|uniref:C2 domain-containing protein n=1 Tax=Dentipellis fragilis TaxID=205917 RepID=A0A4Y9YTP4_9AGAM|nr:hypothetical protein EVG20_g5707 [Dentipellis fragilis]
MSEVDRVIDLKIIRARDLPTPHIWRFSVNSLVLVTPDDKQLFRTDTVSGPNPEWNKVFVVRVPSLSSAIRLQVYHCSKSSECTLLGQTDVSVDGLLRDEENEVRCQLRKSRFNIRWNRGELFIAGKIHTDAAELPAVEESDIFAVAVPGGDSEAQNEAELAALRPSITVSEAESPGESSALTNPPSPAPTFSSLSEPDVLVLPAVIEQTETSVGTLSAPSFLEKTSWSSESAEGTDLSQAAGDVLSNILERVARLGDTFAEVHPYAKPAWIVLSGGYKILKAQVDRDDRVRRLWYMVQDVVTFFDDVKEENIEVNYLKHAMMESMKQIYECCQFLRKYADHGFAGRTLRYTLNPKTDDAVQLLTDSFQTLKEQLSQGIDLDNWRCIRALGEDVSEVKDQVQEIYLHTFLVEGQSSIIECDTNCGCLPGTRTRLINDIMEWIHEPSRGRVLWLSGTVGSGKSSVANTIAGLLKGLGRLGASFRFDRQTDPSAVFRQIAYQLARIDSSVKNAIFSALKQKGNIASAPLSDQAMRIVVEPLQIVDLVGPVVLVIDALDEISHRDTQIRDGILAFFSHEDFALPDYLKIFVTSRDNHHVRLHLQTRGRCESFSIDDYEDTPADIQFFIQHRLGKMQALAEIEDGWPPPGTDEQLAERADRQFIWADITCQFIAENPRLRLPLIISKEAVTHDGTHHLDLLYQSVLCTAHEAKSGNPRYLAEFSFVVGCIAVGKQPFQLEDLDDLLGLRGDCYSEVHLPGREPFSMEGAGQLVSSIRSLFRVTGTV